MIKHSLPTLLISIMVSMLFTRCATPESFSITWPGENLTSLTKITDDDEICFSPYGGDEGTPLFFAVKDGRLYMQNTKIVLEYCNIYRKDNPTSPAKAQKTSGKNVISSPTYCALTDKLAFEGTLEGSSYSDIYMMNATKGKALTQITNTPNDEEEYPCFSKDGKLIVYDKRQSNLGYKDAEIWIKNLENGENILLGKGRMPSFSPDGKKIVFVKYTTDAEHTCLWTMDIDGDNQMQLTDTKLDAVWHPRFSPDGNSIIFDSYNKKRNHVDLYIINKDGGDITQLTANKSYDGQPYWADDGNIYFVSDRGGLKDKRGIWRFRIGDINSSNITNEVVSQQEQTKLIYHVVKQEETINKIASDYGVSVSEIIKWNKLSSTTLTKGQTLKLQVKQ